MAKESFGKNFGKYDKSNEHSKINEYGKGNEKGKERGKKGRGKGQGKDEEPGAKLEFPRLLQVMWQMGTQGRVSVGKGTCKRLRKFRVLLRVQWHTSAATTLAAAKTAASIQEFNDEQEPGWIFGVMGGSVASVTTGTDDQWEDLVWDSGSVSTACPYAWCSDISVNNEDKVYLQDIQQRSIPSHGSRVVPLVSRRMC